MALIIDLTNKIVDAFENRDLAIGILIDLSKAFDTSQYSFIQIIAIWNSWTHINAH